MYTFTIVLASLSHYIIRIYVRIKLKKKILLQVSYNPSFFFVFVINITSISNDFKDFNPTDTVTCTPRISIRDIYFKP